MLTLNSITINCQDFGTCIAVFLSGNKKSIEERYFSFYNHDTTNGDLEWWSDSCAMFWVYDKKGQKAKDAIKRGLVRSVYSELAMALDEDENDLWPQAGALGEARYNSIDWVNWRQSKKYWPVHSLGQSISAEKEVGDFSDVVVGIYKHGKGHLDEFRERVNLDSSIDSLIDDVKLEEVKKELQSNFSCEPISGHLFSRALHSSSK